MLNKAGETAQGNLWRPLDGSHTPPFHEEGKEEGRGRVVDLTLYFLILQPVHL